MKQNIHLALMFLILLGSSISQAGSAFWEAEGDDSGKFSCHVSDMANSVTYEKAISNLRKNPNFHEVIAADSFSAVAGGTFHGFYVTLPGQNDAWMFLASSKKSCAFQARILTEHFKFVDLSNAVPPSARVNLRPKSNVLFNWVSTGNGPCKSLDISKDEVIAESKKYHNATSVSIAEVGGMKKSMVISDKSGTTTVSTGLLNWCAKLIIDKAK